MDQERIVSALFEANLCGKADAKIGLKARFRCQYCQKNLLESVDNFKEWQTDHLVPSIAGGPDAEENYVLCCRTCNFIKGRWNPCSEYAGQHPGRDELIETARKYIQEKRQDNALRLEKFVLIVGQIKF